MKYADITRGYIFQLDGEQYTATEYPSNNGNFRATNSRGNICHLNALEVIRAAAYPYSSHDEHGRKICRKCGAIIINGINGAAMLENCTTCEPPTYPKPHSQPRTTYDADEADAAEARARSINYEY